MRANRINSDSLDWSYIGISLAVGQMTGGRRARGDRIVLDPIACVVSLPLGTYDTSEVQCSWIRFGTSASLMLTPVGNARVRHVDVRFWRISEVHPTLGGSGDQLITDTREPSSGPAFMSSRPS